MVAGRNQAPIPDLRIIPTDSIHAHEDHDSQRSLPLIERLKEEKFIINPPIVAPMGSTQFVVLDGANRCHAFQYLRYPHILVQVVSYESGYVELETWNHIIGGWNAEALLAHLGALPAVELHEGSSAQAVAHLILRDGRVVAVHTPVASTHERNAVLRSVVAVYQQQARLHRTTQTEPEEIWPLYPDAAGLVVFPRYQPVDILEAARFKSYLPPGVSRHVVHGRALRVNYPMDVLTDDTTSLHEKNLQMLTWLQTRLANRQVRYYAESTYQFDE